MPLTDKTKISRYLLSRSHFSAQKGTIKHRAFEPQNGRTSVFLIDGKTEEQIWEQGRQHVSEPQARTLYARADLSVGVVTKHRLLVEVDNTPPDHGNIIQWPMNKSEVMATAQLIAAECILVVIP